MIQSIYRNGKRNSLNNTVRAGFKTPSESLQKTSWQERDRELWFKVV